MWTTMQWRHAERDDIHDAGDMPSFRRYVAVLDGSMQVRLPQYILREAN